MLGVGLLLGIGLGCSSRNSCCQQNNRCRRYNYRCVEYREYDSCSSCHNRCGCRGNCGCGWGHQNCGYGSGW